MTEHFSLEEQVQYKFRNVLENPIIKESPVTAIAVLKTMAEVSEMTRIPVNTLRYYRAVSNKGPRFALIGGRLMAREQDVIAWINEQFEQEAK